MNEIDKWIETGRRSLESLYQRSRLGLPLFQSKSLLFSYITSLHMLIETLLKSLNLNLVLASSKLFLSNNKNQMKLSKI